MDTRQLIQLTVEILATNESSEDAAITELLIKRGVHKSAAHRLVIFVPLAFGRYKLAELFVDMGDGNYQLVDKRGRIIAEKQLANEPEFAMTLELLQEGELAANMNRSVWQGILTRSPEFTAVNDAMLNGAQPKDLKLNSIALHLPLEDTPQRYSSFRSWLRRTF